MAELLLEMATKHNAKC